MEKLSGALRWRTALAALGAAAMVFAAFSPLLKAPFLFDDHTVIEGDGAIAEASANGAEVPGSVSLWRDLWRKPRPLRQLTHRIDWRVSGENPAWPHAANILLHLAVSGAGWLLLRRRCGASAAVATGAALVFLMNPVAVESVGIVSHRKEMLSALFLLAGLDFALRDSARTSPSAIACFLLAAAGKETALAFPAFFALLAWAGMEGSGRFAGGKGNAAPGAAADAGAGRRWLRPFAAYAAFAAVFALLFWWQIHAGMDFAGGNPGEQEVRAGHFTAGVAWGEAVSAALRAFPRNILMLAIPFGHAPDPRIALHAPLVSLETACATAEIVLAAALVAALLRRKDCLAVPLLFVAVSLVPYLWPGLLRIGATAVLADRYLYLASFGFAWALAMLALRLPRRAAVAALALVCAAYGAVSFGLSRRYADEADYWAFASRQNPSSVLAAHNHAWGLWKEHGDFIGARREFRRMMRLAPEFTYGICSFAQMHMEENDPESAFELLDSALRRSPDDRLLHRQRALAGLLFGDDDRLALAHFRKAERLGVGDPAFRYGYATLLQRMLDWPGAAEQFALAGADHAFAEEAAEAPLLLRDPPRRGGGTILCVGDSVPHGTGTDSDGSPEESLAEAISKACEASPLFADGKSGRINAIDASVPGSRARGLPETIDSELKAAAEAGTAVSACLIFSGHNDAIFGARPFDILSALAHAALLCRRAGIAPVIVGPISVRDDKKTRTSQEKTLRELDRKLARFCESAGIRYLSARSVLGENDPSRPSFRNYDTQSGNHLSRQGIEHLAKALVPCVAVHAGFAFEVSPSK